MGLFGKLASGLGLKKAIDKVEDVAGVDIDGDGKRGTATAETASRGVELGEDAEILESKCDGNKRSLFIGINYPGTKGELRGCINDVKNIKKFMVEKFNFPTTEDNMRTLVDDNTGTGLPTKANILAGFKWLVEGAKEGDSLFLHYSGHGGTQKDVAPDTDEADNQDETLIPCDYEKNGVIVDDEIHEMLVKHLPDGVRLTAMMDCCHSGSVFDLPYSYSVDGNLEITETDNRKAAIEAAIKAGKAYFAGDTKAAMAGAMSAVTGLMKGGGGDDEKKPDKDAVHIKTTLADVVQFSGCKDHQTSADATIAGEATGAMSWAFIDVLNKHGDAPITYVELLQKIRTTLNGKFGQIPCMSAGHKVNLAKSNYIM